MTSDVHMLNSHIQIINEMTKYDNVSIDKLTSMPGKGVTSDPVAMSIFFVETFSWEPSFFATDTSFGPVMVP